MAASFFIFCIYGRKCLHFARFDVTIPEKKQNSLIKSDGGTGPVKSGNLLLQGANSRSIS